MKPVKKKIEPPQRKIMLTWQVQYKCKEPFRQELLFSGEEDLTEEMMVELFKKKPSTPPKTLLEEELKGDIDEQS